MARGLTKAKIVQAGLDVLDEAGLDRLTVRAVAARLDVQAPALYWHVRDKQQLSMRWRPNSGVSWCASWPRCPRLPDGRTACARSPASTRRILLSHRDGAKVFTGTYLTDTEMLRAQEEPLARMIARDSRSGTSCAATPCL